MDFQTKLRNYAKLIVHHGLNVQDGQLVNLVGEVYHRDLLALVADEAYARGARFVGIDLIEPRLARTRLQRSKAEDLAYVPRHVTARMDELVDAHAANLRLTGSEFPEIIADQDPKRINTVRVAYYKAVKRFYDEGIGRSQVHWTVAAAATPEWGKKVFPAAPSGAEAERLLWEEIFRLCRVDRADYLEVWKQHNAALHERARKLTELKIRRLHFTGPGTDLYVGLSPKAVFKGGGDLSPRGVEYEPNLPTEECFTTPDWRRTEGVARATRPFLINGKMIRGLELVFKGGEIASFKAVEGADTFREYIASDAGGRRLGEVALVGVDSPVFASGLVYEEILFDENAACHIAVGSAYKFCLSGGAQLSAAELAELGCNESSVHTDMMISDESVDVHAERTGGERIMIIRRGAWADF